MNYKRLLILMMIVMVSFSLTGCKDIENLPPELVSVVDGEFVSLITVEYEHTSGTVFDPDAMLQSLIDNGQLIAIDYIQTGVIWGNDRNYEDISSEIVIPTFYARWFDGDDANFDDVVDEADEEYYGTYKTDIDGNHVFDETIIFLVGIFPAGSDPFSFTIEVYDAEGASTSLSGTIVFV